MVRANERWGQDLRLLRNLQLQTDRDRGRDFATVERAETAEIDLAVWRDEDNLKQALLLRFLTRMGELEPLGHPDYGSRLFELLGRPNTQTNRNRAKLFTLQALMLEPRVEAVKSVQVRTHPANRNRIDIDIALTPIDSDTVLNFVFPFFLEGEVI